MYYSLLKCIKHRTASSDIAYARALMKTVECDNVVDFWRQRREFEHNVNRIDDLKMDRLLNINSAPTQNDIWALECAVDHCAKSHTAKLVSSLTFTDWVHYKLN